jgi:hypothetical protein
MSGHANSGNALLLSPISPTVFKSKPKLMLITVIRIIATNGAGTTVVQTLGSAIKLAAEHENGKLSGS